jgi:hypothetical protein
MISFKLTGFQGIKPRVSPRLIGDAVAQIAANCRLSSGELSPSVEPSVVASPETVGPLLSIYRADTIWLTWPYDVDVVRSPLEASEKFIFTGQNEPRITTIAMASGLSSGDYPESSRALGIPNPQTAPSVTPSGGVGAVVSRFYCYTFYSDWNEESGTSPLTALLTGKVDDTWAVTGMDATPANTGSGTASYGGGVTTFTNSGSVKHWLRAGDGILLGASHVVVSEVVSPTVFRVAGNYAAATTWEREAYWGTCTKRLYRSAGTTGQFQLVAEGITGTTYNDSLSDANILGDELISASWVPAPANLRGLILLPSGALAGIDGDEIRFSEPLQPHAWPPEYTMRAPGATPVALGVYTSGIVVGTTGKPSVILGHEPGQMASQPVDQALPCVSKRSMVSFGDSAAYASVHGMVRIGDSGLNTLTQDWFSRDEWALYSPGAMVAAVARGRLYLTATYNGQQQILSFDFLDQTGLTVSYLKATAMFSDPVTGKLYVSTSDQQDVREFDPVNGLYQSLDWMSKEFIANEPVNLGAARVNMRARYTAAQIAEMQAIYDATVAANQALMVSAALPYINELRWSEQPYQYSWALSSLVGWGLSTATSPDGGPVQSIYCLPGYAGPYHTLQLVTHDMMEDFSCAVRFKLGASWSDSNDLRFEVYNPDTLGAAYIWIDTTDMSIHLVGEDGSATVASSSITSLGGGWYEAAWSGNLNYTSSTTWCGVILRIIRASDGITSYSIGGSPGDPPTQEVYLWQTQMNPGLVLSGYARTTWAAALTSIPGFGDALNDTEINVHTINGSILADAYPPNTEPPGATFTLYVDGDPIFTRVVTDNTPFRLPSGYLSDTFAVRVQGQTKVLSIDLAETMEGLKNA